MADATEFHWELMKLLLQVVWADDDVGDPEREAMRGFAQKLSLSAEQVAEVEAFMAGGRALPPPNIPLLRGRREEVVEAAEELVLADDVITDDENRVLAELASLLQPSEPPPPR